MVVGSPEERDGCRIPRVRREARRPGAKIFHAVGVRSRNAGQGVNAKAVGVRSRNAGLAASCLDLLFKQHLKSGCSCLQS